MKIVSNRVEQFAPLPVRAIGDPKLSAIHLRTLAAIAYHDRFSGSKKVGQGCWASNKTLAQRCGVNITNLSTAISDLASWGYLERRKLSDNKRQRVLVVNYDDLPIGKFDTLPIGKGSGASKAGVFAPEAKPPFAPEANSGFARRNMKSNKINGVSDPQYNHEYSHEDITLKRRIDFAEASPSEEGASLQFPSRSSASVVTVLHPDRGDTEAVDAFDAYCAALEKIGA